MIWHTTAHMYKDKARARFAFIYLLFMNFPIPSTIYTGSFHATLNMNNNNAYLTWIWRERTVFVPICDYDDDDYEYGVGAMLVTLFC